jgi:hypothetical protein
MGAIMSILKTIIGILVCVGALFWGAVIGMAMGGYGICALSLTTSLVVYSAITAAVLSGVISLIWRRVWWMGALTFSLPTLLGIGFAAVAGDSARLIAICACILVSFITAFLVRYPSRKDLKS